MSGNRVVTRYGGGQSPDSGEARRKYRGLAAVYDRRIRFIAPMRRRVIQLLCLRPGDQVLDMGCGTGASFAALREAVGPTGRVTGVELSEEWPPWHAGGSTIKVGTTSR